MKIGQLTAEEIAERNKGEIAALDAFEAELAAFQQGPRVINVTSCNGCVFLKHYDWETETDGGIYAHCKNKGEKISDYWHPKMQTPTWCPFLIGESK